MEDKINKAKFLSLVAIACLVSLATFIVTCSLFLDVNRKSPKDGTRTPNCTCTCQATQKTAN